jgi:hypothetical protein
MIAKIESWLLDVLQKRCQHKSSHVKADILEGAIDLTQVQWCQHCGAWRYAFGDFCSKEGDAPLDC